jgi:hypothetical protein
MMKALQPEGEIILDSKTSNQVGTFLTGIDLISEKCPDFDKLICTRFDLVYLKSILDWNIWGQDKGIYLPWREYESSWKREHRVGDAIHVIDKGFVDTFRSALNRQLYMLDIHWLFDELAKETKKVFFIEDGYFDSNSLFSNIECYNPLYRIANRPRLPIRQPFLANPPGEIGLRWNMFVIALASEFSQLKYDLGFSEKQFGILGALRRVLKSARLFVFAGGRALRFNRVRVR